MSKTKTIDELEESIIQYKKDVVEKVDFLKSVGVQNIPLHSVYEILDVETEGIVKCGFEVNTDE
tara:strand:- start:335 stop:526 length:192 start_codon:yes stop_codon:yes gene_type:complete